MTELYMKLGVNISPQPRRGIARTVDLSLVSLVLPPSSGAKIWNMPHPSSKEIVVALTVACFVLFLMFIIHVFAFLLFSLFLFVFFKTYFSFPRFKTIYFVMVLAFLSPYFFYVFFLRFILSWNRYTGAQQADRNSRSSGHRGGRRFWRRGCRGGPAEVHGVLGRSPPRQGGAHAREAPHPERADGAFHLPAQGGNFALAPHHRGRLWWCTPQEQRARLFNSEPSRFCPIVALFFFTPSCRIDRRRRLSRWGEKRPGQGRWIYVRDFLCVLVMVGVVGVGLCFVCWCRCVVWWVLLYAFVVVGLCVCVVVRVRVLCVLVLMCACACVLLVVLLRALAGVVLI